MFKAKLKLKIWAYTYGVNCAHDWYIDDDSIGTIDQALASEYKVAAVPVKFNLPYNFCYQSGNENIDLSQFDLVLLSDIEFSSVAEITDWAQNSGISNWALLAGGQDLAQPFDFTRYVYRPWWIYNRDIKFNQLQDITTTQRPFMFDALLGSRRPNRDFVMLSMQHHGLLDKNIVTYRDVFTGSYTNPVTEQVQKQFDGVELQWPYVSPNLDPAWEVSDAIAHSDSQTVPWNIYQQTYCSIAAESVSSGSMFFMAEKISKPMMAQRPFIVFGIQGYLAHLNRLGYKTFHPYIDESYDLVEDDIQRWTMAFEQVLKLHKTDCELLCDYVEERLSHNRKMILSTEHNANHNIVKLLRLHIASEFWLN